MAAAGLSEKICAETIAALELANGNVTHAAESLGLTRNTFRSRLSTARLRTMPVAEILPDKRMPTVDIVEHKKLAFQARRAHSRAKLWRQYRIPSHGPYALMFFGDPHLDDDGCDIELFEAHAQLAAATPNLFAVNIGDSTNNWAGRLSNLWAEQSSSADDARAFVKHYLADSGIPWFLWLHGNHDLWPGPLGRDFFGGVCPAFVEMEDWQAKITLVSPNGHELRLWAAHNFKGNSIWNNMHGLERAAQMQDWAHLYVAGHHHDVGYRQGENAARRFIYNLLRVRGYKFDDSYAELHGFAEYQYGAAAVAVVDPAADKLNAVTCFLDPFEGVEFLKFKRRGIA